MSDGNPSIEAVKEWALGQGYDRVFYALTISGKDIYNLASNTWFLGDKCVCVVGGPLRAIAYDNTIRSTTIEEDKKIGRYISQQTIPQDIEATKHDIDTRRFGNTPEEKEQYVKDLTYYLHWLEEEAKVVITL